jgi:hypothetical protein
VTKALFPDRRVIWLPVETAWARPTNAIVHCCASMAKALEFECRQHDDPFECPDALVIYNEVMDEYGLIIHDGTESYLLIDCCPWCGTRLPASARDEWFDAVDGLDLAEGIPPPTQYLTSAWRRRV